MLLAQAGCMFVGFILHISEVQGQVEVICALKGSSVDLLCSAERPTSSMRWYTVHWDGSQNVQNEISADGNRVSYNTSEESNFTLTINDLRESDAKFYCCRETDKPGHCRLTRTELHVTDLQVKVIPTTEAQTVTLMCSTSCTLAENPAAYIWYKNREVLYQDWSPWYQHLVSSEAADRYSCAIEGYEDLRAPEVSVDSVTPTCFTVTYAKGRMCSYQQKSENEPCSITYPKELHVQRIHSKNYDILTCQSGCPAVDPQAAYRWYWNRDLYDDCENQNITIYRFYQEIISCAVKYHEDLHSNEICLGAVDCWIKNYGRRRICALEGFSVNILSEYSHPNLVNEVEKTWYKMKYDLDYTEIVPENPGRVEYHDKMRNKHVLRINNLEKNDSGEYIFEFFPISRQPVSHGVFLVVTGLRVTMTPSAVVTEGQRVTLTCSTSCPLTDNSTYIWYMNGGPLTPPENQNKYLVLDPVGIQDAGNYSCAVKTDVTQYISSLEEALTVKAREKTVQIMNAAKLIILCLMLPAVLLFFLRMRKKKTPTSTAELRDNSRTGQNDLLYESIALEAINPAAQVEPAEKQGDTV